jgi:hypothetical protein
MHVLTVCYGHPADPAGVRPRRHGRRSGLTLRS